MFEPHQQLVFHLLYSSQELQAQMSGGTVAPSSANGGPPSPPASVAASSSFAPSFSHSSMLSAAYSAPPSQSQPETPPNEDLWAPKWEDTGNAEANFPQSAAAAPAPLTPAPLPPALLTHIRNAAESPPQHVQQQKQQTPVEEMLSQSQSPPLPPQGSNWPPQPLAAAEGGAAVDALLAGFGGLDFGSRLLPQALLPPSAAPMGGAPATMTTGHAPGSVPPQQPDEFDDLLDMLMAN